MNESNVNEQTGINC